MEKAMPLFGRTRQGGIHHQRREILPYPLLPSILSFLNITEILRGELSDMGWDGFAYKSIKLKGDIQNGPLLQHEVVIEDDIVNAVGRVRSISLIIK